MTRILSIAAVQAAPLLIGASHDQFADQVAEILANDPTINFLVYPELHLFNTDLTEADERNIVLDASAIKLTDPLVLWLGNLARQHAVWFMPGSICELGENGELFNTSLVFSPTGELVSTYRKIFPWRPFEPYVPGDRFEVFEIPNLGKIGVSICYDAWFPEVTRHLAWMGAEVVINIVKTTSADRAQEVILAQANSIVNQTFTVSIDCGGPVGMGHSLIVDPEGKILAQAPHADFAVLRADLDLDRVTEVRQNGTAGTNRMWSQFLPTDAPLELPLYNGRIDPNTFNPEH